MHEEHWFSGTDPTPMLAFLQDSGRASERKLRLFACACCRRLPGPLWEWPWEVQVVEYHIEGAASDDELAAVRRRAEDYRWRGGYNDTPEERRTLAALTAYQLAAGLPVEAEEVARHAAEAVPEGARRVAERAAQAALVREVFGNPFRPVSVDAAWLSWNAGAVPHLAGLAYVEQNESERSPLGHLDAARLAILADMLEEAGATDAQLLSHLRGPGPHVRGCHGLDAILGRA